MNVNIEKDYTEFVDVLDRASNSVSRANIFLKKIASCLFGQESVDSEKFMIVDGSGDNGIDAFIFNLDGAYRNLYLIQGKSGKNVSKDDVYADIEKMIFGLEAETVNSTILGTLKSGNCERVIIEYWTLNPIKELDLSAIKNLEIRFNELDIISALNNSVEIIFRDYKSILSDDDCKRKLANCIFRLTGSFLVCPTGANNCNTTYTGYVYVRDLCRLLLDVQRITGDKDYIFINNLRGFMGLTTVNREIFKTVINNPEEFYILNNGVVMVAKNPELIDSACLEFSFPSIIDGCQSSSTILKAIKEVGKRLGLDFNTYQGILEVFTNPRYEKMLSRIELIDVTDFTSAQVVETSLARNRRNNIQPEHKLTNKDLFKELNDLLKSNGYRWFPDRLDEDSKVSMKSTNKASYFEISEYFKSVFARKNGLCVDKYDKNTLYSDDNIQYLIDQYHKFGKDLMFHDFLMYELSREEDKDNRPSKTVITSVTCEKFLQKLFTKYVLKDIYKSPTDWTNSEKLLYYKVIHTLFWEDSARRTALTKFAQEFQEKYTGQTITKPIAKEGPNGERIMVPGDPATRVMIDIMHSPGRKNKTLSDTELKNPSKVFNNLCALKEENLIEFNSLIFDMLYIINYINEFKDIEKDLKSTAEKLTELC